MIVVMRPINTINNKPARTTREVKVRPLPKSGLVKFEAWIQEQDWRDVIKAESVDEKAEILHNMVLNKLNECCPEKNRKISSDDDPWYTEKLKKLQRKKARLFRKNRNSKQFKKIKDIYDNEVKKAKRDFKTRTIDDVLTLAVKSQ